MEPALPAIVALTLATALGAGVQAATGFGFAVLAAPVFLAALGSTTAVPILVALHVIQSALLVPRVWRAVPSSELLRLLAGAVVGCPVGLALFRVLDLGQLKLAAGAVILLSAALLAVRRLRVSAGATAPVPAPRDPPAAMLALTGALSGALTALLVMPGPPLMVALMQRPMAATAARALSLSFFAACYVAVLAMAMAGHQLDGTSWRTVAKLSPAVVVGTFAGLGLAHRLSDGQFLAALNILLVLAGVGAIVSAF